MVVCKKSVQVDFGMKKGRILDMSKSAEIHLPDPDCDSKWTMTKEKRVWDLLDLYPAGLLSPTEIEEFNILKTERHDAYQKIMGLI